MTKFMPKDAVQMISPITAKKLSPLQHAPQATQSSKNM
jgi:hypothetical protein